MRGSSAIIGLIYGLVVYVVGIGRMQMFGITFVVVILGFASPHIGRHNLIPFCLFFAGVFGLLYLVWIMTLYVVGKMAIWQGALVISLIGSGTSSFVYWYLRLCFREDVRKHRLQLVSVLLLFQSVYHGVFGWIFVV